MRGHEFWLFFINDILKMTKQKLFDDESEEEVDLKTENEYAKKYDKWRGKEEIHKRESFYFVYLLNKLLAL